MKDLYPIPSVLNVLIVTLQLVAFLVCLLLLKNISSWPSLLVLAMLFGVVMNSIYSSIHEAHHRLLFKNRYLNDACGILLALLFPAPFHLLRQGHLGHHRRNRSDDEAFDLYFEDDNKIWKFIAWYGILLGFYWILVALSNVIILFIPWLMNPKLWSWDRTSTVFLSHFSPKSFKIMWFEALAAVALHAALIVFLDLSWQNYAIMYFGFGWMWSSLQYVHHYQAERDVLNGAYNLFLWAPLDLIWLNHNWHQTHHQIPMIPWLYLRKAAAEKGVQSKALLPAYLRMWKGPQAALQQIHNRYVGEVTR